MISPNLLQNSFFVGFLVVVVWGFFLSSKMFVFNPPLSLKGCLEFFIYLFFNLIYQELLIGC